MRKQFWAGLIVVACSVGIGAAGQTTGQTADQSQRSSSQNAANQITVTGCVQRAGATSGATGTSGTASSASSTDSAFILTNASMAGSSGAHPGAGSTAGGTTTGGTTTGGTTAGTTGATSMPSTAAGASGGSYKLEGDASKLAAHVGHKVEITGTLDKSSSMSSSPSSGTAAGGTTSSSSSSGSMANTQQKLKVDTVRMIASSCTE